MYGDKVIYDVDSLLHTPHVPDVVSIHIDLDISYRIKHIFCI